MAKGRRTERAVAAGLRAVRSVGVTFPRDVTRAIIARGNPQKQFAQSDAARVRRAVGEVIRGQFTGRDAPMKVAAAETILNAAGGRINVARDALTRRNEFGKTLAQELNGARNKLTRRVNRIVNDGIRRGRSRQEIAKDAADVVRRNYETKRVVAWHAARTANRAIVAALREKAIINVLISASPSHPTPDICDENFGVHRLPYPLPPYHPFCTCIASEP